MSKIGNFANIAATEIGAQPPDDTPTSEHDEQSQSGDKLDKILEALSVLNNTVQELDVRQRAADADILDLRARNANQGVINAEQYRDLPAGNAQITAEIDNSYQNYSSIKDSVARIKLPAELLLPESGLVIKPGEAKNRLAFVKKASSFTTTTLKVLKEVGDRGSVNGQDLDNILACLTAQQHMFQIEQNLCVVEGTGVSKDTLQLYKFISKNPTFGHADAQALESACRITLATGQTSNGNRGSRGGHSSFRGNGRFRGNSSNQRGGRYNNNSDRFQSNLSNNSSAP